MNLHRKMKKEFSIYLDVIRFMAAFLVFLHHLNIRAISQKIIPFGNLADISVLSFFVMSGCVIAYVAETKEDNLRLYAASRLARIYSVALPTVLLVPLLDALGRNLGGVFYENYPADNHVLRIIISLLFINEFWNQSVLLFSNSPYWSLCYEVWYYIAFGVACYIPSRYRYFLLAAIALLVGPKILILSPVWILGIFLYKVDKKKPFRSEIYIVMATSAAAGIACYEIFGFREMLVIFSEKILSKEALDFLLHAKGFMADWLLASFVFVHLLGMKAASSHVSALLLSVERPVKFLAQYTFPLYLLHQPLTYFWSSLISIHVAQPHSVVITVLLVLISVKFIGDLTEKLRTEIKGRCLRLFGIPDSPKHG